MMLLSLDLKKKGKKKLIIFRLLCVFQQHHKYVNISTSLNIEMHIYIQYTVHKHKYYKIPRFGSLTVSLNTSSSDQ